MRSFLFSLLLGFAAFEVGSFSGTAAVSNDRVRYTSVRYLVETYAETGSIVGGGWNVQSRWKSKNEAVARANKSVGRWQVVKVRTSREVVEVSR